MPGLRNHWRPREAWPPGRHRYACHLLLDDQPDLRDLIRQYQDALAGLSILGRIPDRWLHMTMQRLVFVDQIDASGLDRVTEALRERLADFAAPTATFHRPTIVSEAVYLRADPPGPLYDLRLAMHEAVAAALPPETFPEPRPQPGSFQPHVSLAYVERDAPDDAPIRAALRDVEPKPVTATFPAASLLEFHRDHLMWEWTRIATLPLGP